MTAFVTDPKPEFGTFTMKSLADFIEYAKVGIKHSLRIEVASIEILGDSVRIMHAEPKVRATRSDKGRPKAGSRTANQTTAPKTDAGTSAKQEAAKTTPKSPFGDSKAT